MAIFEANVEQTIDRLFRLSAVIRSAGMSFPYAKAANFFEYEHEVNLTRKFREGVELLFKHKRSSPCSYMVKRLVESICLRQQELAYSQHCKRGPSGRKAAQETIQSGGVVSLSRSSKSAYMPQGGSVPMIPAEISVRPVVPRAASQKFSKIDDALSNLPPPPEKPQQPELECPFCAFPFESSMFVGSAWRYHALYLFVTPLSYRVISWLK